MDYYTLSALIRKYRAGIATPEERYLLDTWWQEAQRDMSVLEKLDPAERDMLKARMFAETQQRIGRLERPSRPLFSRGIYRVAAAVSTVAVAVSLLYWSTHRMTTLHTRPGERLSVTLPDSSHVVLNGNTTLRYSPTWDDEKTREVWIDGEAFFAVQHTVHHQKFIVHTPHALNVEVLGTKFNVRSREQQAEVMLTEGKVKLAIRNSDTAPVYLNPGELATVAGHTVSKRVAEQKPYTSWITNTLVFKRTPLREIASRLHDTYGLTVTFSDSTLANRELSGEIGSATADDILKAVAETFNLKISRDDTNVTLTSTLAE